MSKQVVVIDKVLIDKVYKAAKLIPDDDYQKGIIELIDAIYKDSTTISIDESIEERAEKSSVWLSEQCGYTKGATEQQIIEQLKK